MAATTFHDGADATVPGLSTLNHFSAAFFTLTLLTDVLYMRTVVLMWQDFSSWLLFFGLISGGVAVLLWLIGVATGRPRVGWGVVILQVLVLVLAVINSLVHAGDGWTAVVPWGIGLSAVTCVLMLVAAALGRRTMNRHRT
ncbi:DUF2231 domain-containing protein [Paracoccus beibuensis]|uniref:DUF2231 domain-containing protein n=1 Tax=Paracoccus beibuensis TaxID=547602 RepID=UPI002240CF63|nr:DUF2231 domain-containing protein [Paracoccus beibuensis]